MNNISNLAYVHPEAKLGDNITIDAFAYIDRDVEIGDGCHIHPQATLRPGARIGKNTKIYEGSVIAATPQDFRWDGKESLAVIGDNNVIREHVIINRSIHEGEATVIGNGNFIMAHSHVGHDSKIGNNCVLGNAVRVAGRCVIGDCTILSSNALVHEKCEIGEWVLIKGGCRVTNHVPPYCVMAHNPISYYGVNAYVMRRNNFTEQQIDDIAKCYRHVYQCNTSVFNAMRRIEVDVPQTTERDNILVFIKNHENNLAAAPDMEMDF
ncbi:MAG: acyl-ACP--UDP-N-acetylglucosamine O-acyltransferase [Muribaculum sp.]|nr:acyl-ACP--UDP-N-acetylglucosamine O-acyltransferase [Muribaculum sp.]